MLGFIVFVFIIVFFVVRAGLARRVKVLEKKLTDAEDEIRIVTRRVTVLEGGTPASPAAEFEVPSAETVPPPEPFETVKAVPPLEPVAKQQVTPEIEVELPEDPDLLLKVLNTPPGDAVPPVESEPPPVNVPPAKPVRQKASKPVPVLDEDRGPSFWHKMEKQFIENWTGILGTIILVLGVGFLGIYTALKMSEVFRFFMVVGFAAILGGLFVFLKGKEKWLKLALWLRSGSGAIFLFACLGAGGIPGLHWIHNPLYALVVLILGICVNLYLAYIGGKQVFASLHVILSLAALCIAPQNSTTFIIGALVSLAGVVLTFREKWDYHLLLTISAFFAYHLFWLFQVKGENFSTSVENVVGIISVCTVCIAAAFVHYRRAYATKQFDKLPFAVHLINWFYLGLSLLVHITGSKWKTIPIFAGAFAAFFLAKRARKMEIKWLHTTDTLIAQVMAVIGFISLYQWGVDYFIITALIFAESLLFFKVMTMEKEELLYKITGGFAEVSSVALIISSFLCIDYGKAGFSVRTGGIMFLCSIASFFLARSSRKNVDEWFYRSFTTIAQVLAAAGIMTLFNCRFDDLLLFAVLFAETLFFTALMTFEKDILLYRFGIIQTQIATFALIVASFITGDIFDSALAVKHCIILFVCAVLNILFYLRILKSRDSSFILYDSIFGSDMNFSWNREFSISGLLSGVLVLAAGIHLYTISGSVYILSMVACLLLIVRPVFSSTGFSAGTCVLVIGSFIISWFKLDGSTSTSPLTLFSIGAPLYFVASFCIVWSYLKEYKVHVKWIGIYLLVIHTMILSYFVFRPVSNVICGVLWLLLSLPALEISKWLTARYGKEIERAGHADRFLLHAGYALIAAFLIRHFIVNLQAEQYLGIFKVRLLIEILALVTFGYWGLTRKPSQEKSYGSWRLLHPLFLELFLLFFIVTISLEVDKFWHAIIWIGTAGVALGVGYKRKDHGSRLVFYSLLFFFASIFQVTFLRGVYDSLAISWFEQSWVLSCFAIVLQMIFLIFFYKSGSLKNVLFPPPLAKLEPFTLKLDTIQNSISFYPLIIGIALFLFYSFDKSILTLLWVVECFTIFSISIILREMHFRYVSLIALALCIVRLIFFDLSKTSTLTRALVFLGVGVLMLGMHSLYNKYKGRFENEKT